MGRLDKGEIKMEFWKWLQNKFPSKPVWAFSPDEYFKYAEEWKKLEEKSLINEIIIPELFVEFIDGEDRKKIFKIFDNINKGE